MKSLKKVLVLVLAFVMLAGLAVTALADEAPTAAEGPFTIKINNAKEGHEYDAYQIFSGKLATTADGSKILTEIAWGSGVTPEDGKIGGKTAAEWVTYLQGKGTDSDEAKEFANAVAQKLSGVKTTSTNGSMSVNEAGYYLIKDANVLATDDAYTRYILEVVGNVEVDPKSDVPKVGKEVLDNNDSDKDDSTNKWGDSADHDIGDEVEFKLTGTLPTNYEDYKSYKFIFHDTMSAGLDLVEGSFSVEINGKTIPQTEFAKYGITVEKDSDDCTFDVKFADLKAESLEDFKITNETEIVVKYKAKLNDKAVIGNYGNPNTVDLEFSNNPNYTGDGEEDDTTGKTPPETVRVFTYELDVNKVDSDKHPLTGAEFTLEKFIEDESGTLDEKLGKTGRWEKVKETTAKPGSTFEFKGLDDGNYRLTETKAPAGYNKLSDPIYFEITAEHDGTETEASVPQNLGKFTVDNGENGKISTDVENNKGNELPSTGGIGTTIFYIVGGLLVLVAGVLLIAKRRMKVED